jgi:hypothetical protein
VFALLGSRAVAAPGNVTTEKANGDTVIVNTFDAVPLDLTVDRNGTGSKAVTQMFFNQSTCDDTGCRGIFGFGTIPNSDLSVGPGAAHLNTNLASNPSFTAFSFVNDFVNNIFTQTPITGGMIQIDWKAIPHNSTKQSGQSTVSANGFSIHRSGNSIFNSATATGTFFGAPIGPGQNAIGTSNSMTILIQHD